MSTQRIHSLDITQLLCFALSLPLTWLVSLFENVMVYDAYWTSNTQSAIRIRQYRKARIVYPARVLTSATYCTVIVYLFILNMLATGAGLHDYELCKVAIYICLVFYGTVKGLLLYFMAERVRTVRSMDIARKHDKLWISCVVIITLGLSGVVATALAKANYSFKEEMGMCRVGIPDGATVAVLMFDLVMNAWLTGSFLCKSPGFPRLKDIASWLTRSQGF